MMYERTTRGREGNEDKVITKWGSTASASNMQIQELLFLFWPILQPSGHAGKPGNGPGQSRTPGEHLYPPQKHKR